METTQTNNDTLNEGVNMIEKMFNERNSMMTAIYKKQMDFAVGFYTNLFNQGLVKNNSGNENKGLPNMFANMDMTKWFAAPQAGASPNNFQNPVYSSFDKMMKQAIEMNKNFFSVATHSNKGQDPNSGQMNEEYKKVIEARLETSKKIMSTLSDAIKEQLESSNESNKKTMEEINSQFALLMKQNQKLWADMLTTNQNSLMNGAKTEKEIVANESKKSPLVSVSEVLEHNSKQKK
jgi:hypothetical protein